LERDNKQLNERLEISSKAKMTEQGGLEKKLDKVMEENGRLNTELD
jgi:beta-lactamase class A